MFKSEIYIRRRKKLLDNLSNGILFFPGNSESPMNYPSNTYKFRQDSNFLYYFGLDEPNIFGAIDIDSGESILFVNEREVDDIVWSGPDKSPAEKAQLAGAEKTMPVNQLEDYFRENIHKGRKIHFLPQYRAETKLFFAAWLGLRPSRINDYASEDLIKAVVAQRSVKSEEEIAEIENALNISYEMNLLAMKATQPGMLEREIYGAVEGIALGAGHGVSFPVIFSVRGETLHNHSHNNIMQDGDLAVLDSGAESLEHYASDITRTFPVNGKFSDKQRAIYQIVLNAQLSAIDMVKPGVFNKEIHLKAAEVITEGLKEIGLMKGNTQDAVKEGAHALFFPHGLGHMLGLDVHDMEGLGENFVGYNDEIKRSSQFGLAYLRLAKKLQPGFVFTIEPGIYFIPALIEQWKNENKLAEFINYDETEKYMGFGGVRIEDNILVVEGGHRVLGKPIPKTIDEVEDACKG